jgi:uncharacterized membrane protein YiaA
MEEMMSHTPQQSNPLGNASLVLGILSAALVFGIGLFIGTLSLASRGG